MMMKTVSVLLLSIFGSALAAPAVVWKKGGPERRGLRTSDELKASAMLADVISTEREAVKDSSLSVVFLLGRGQDGSESLSTMAASGALPTVAAKYNNADCIHHHVSGVESPETMLRDAARASPAQNALLISLNELNSVLTSRTQPLREVEINHNGVASKTQRYSHKRAQELAGADIVIVQVDPKKTDSAVIDSAIAGAIDNESISSVVLTAVRSHDEVKQARQMEHNRRLSMMKTSGKNNRRRLEDQGEDGGEEDGNQNNNGQNNNNNNGDDMTGVYYVNMTPNILAGILFTIMFTVTTYIGVTCMGMIAGQDVYVKKLPAIGREA